MPERPTWRLFPSFIDGTMRHRWPRCQIPSYVDEKVLPLSLLAAHESEFATDTLTSCSLSIRPIAARTYGASASTRPEVGPTIRNVFRPATMVYQRDAVLPWQQEIWHGHFHVW